MIWTQSKAKQSTRSNDKWGSIIYRQILLKKKREKFCHGSVAHRISHKRMMPKVLCVCVCVSVQGIVHWVLQTTCDLESQCNDPLVLGLFSVRNCRTARPSVSQITLCGVLLCVLFYFYCLSLFFDLKEKCIQFCFRIIIHHFTVNLVLFIIHESVSFFLSLCSL